MIDVNLAVGNSKKLIEDSNNTLDEIEYITQTINKIYETFDTLKASWTGEKSDEYKKTLEEFREPLKTMCRLSTQGTEGINEVGKKVSEYMKG